MRIIRKAVPFLWIAAVLGALIYGLYMKGTYTDKLIGTGEEKFWVYQNTYYLKDEDFQDEDEIENAVDEAFSRSDLIARATYTGRSEYVEGQIIFWCEVSEVYKGDGSLTGREIAYVARDMIITAEFEMNSGTRINYMNKGEEYLVFGEQLSGYFSPIPDNYYLSCGVTSMEYFSFSEHDNKLVTLEPLTKEGYEKYYGFTAKNYPDNEFFAVSDGGLQNALELKRKIFERLESGSY